MSTIHKFMAVYDSDMSEDDTGGLEVDSDDENFDREPTPAPPARPEDHDGEEIPNIYAKCPQYDTHI